MKKLKKNSINVSVLLMILAVLLLTSCQDIGLLLSQLDDEVKVANDRYLQVTDTFPEQNDQNLSPKVPVTITFDRSIDPSSIKEYLRVEMRDAEGNEPDIFAADGSNESFVVSFTDGDLKIEPYPYWAGGEKIIFSLIAGAPALDGTILRDTFSWSFYTAKVPIGIIELDPGIGAQPGYTNSSSVKPRITYSNSFLYFLANTEAEAVGVVYDTPGWLDTSSLSAENEVLPNIDITSYESSGVDGSYTVYALFKDDRTNTVSDYVSGSIILDQVNPSVTGTGFGPVGPVNSSFLRSGTASDIGSGVYDTNWISSPPGVIFGSPDSLSTTIAGPPSTDESYTITVEAVDYAGNKGSAAFNLEWDTAPPTPPVVTSSSLTTDNTPEWTWTSSTSTDSVESYRRSLNGGTWYTDTDNSYIYFSKTGGLPDGKHTLYVTQYDALGNLSSSGSYGQIVNVAQVSPYDNEIGISTSVKLEWPTTSKASYSYSLYRGNPDDQIRDTLIISGDTGAYNYVTPKVKLSTGTGYFWRYTVIPSFGLPVTSDSFKFTTVKF